MGRDFVPVKYRRGSRGRCGFYFTTEKQPDGRWKPVRLLSGEPSEENRLRAYQIYLARQEKSESAELPGDLYVRPVPPRIELLKRTPHTVLPGLTIDRLESVNVTRDAFEAYLATLPSEQARLVREQQAAFEEWAQTYGMKYRVDSVRTFERYVRGREAEIIAERAGRLALGMADTTPSKTRLQDCLDAWIQDREADRDPYDRKYLSNVRVRFRRFMAVVGLDGRLTCPVGQLTAQDSEKGNLPLHELNAQHFADFRLWAARQPSLGTKALNDHMLAVGTVLRHVDRTRPAWQVPPQLLTWASKHLQRERYEPGDEHSEPTPVPFFQILLAKADEWAASRADGVVGPRRRGDRSSRPNLRRRQGIVMRAVLLFKLNVAGDNVDLSRLRPEQLKDLDGSLPWVDLPRPKVRHKKGKPIPRRIPLLPGTVAALECLRKLRPDRDRVFIGEDGPLTSSGLTQAYRELADSAGVAGYTLKHLRNVGGTIGTRKGVASYLVDALLGHVIPTTAKPYIDRHGFTAADLVPIVNVIGEEYLGEAVGHTVADAE